MGEWAPPLQSFSSPTPPSRLSQKTMGGCGKCKSLSFTAMGKAWEKGKGREIAPKPYQLTAWNDKTQRKGLQMLGVWCFIGLCKWCIKLQIAGVCKAWQSPGPKIFDYLIFFQMLVSAHLALGLTLKGF